MGYDDEVLADEPAWYLKLDETEGTTASDSSGNGRHATWSGSPTLGVSGLFAHQLAAEIHGSEMLTLDAESGDEVDDFTLEAWFASEVPDIKFIYRDAAAGSTRFQFNIDDDPAVLRGRVYQSNGSSTGPDGSLELDDGDRHHVVMVVEDGTIDLYVDGEHEATGTFSGYFRGGSPGFELFGSRGNPQGEGVFGRMAFYRHALSPQRIAAHYAAVDQDDTPIATPTNVQVAVTSRTSAEVTWDDVPEADVFQVLGVQVRAGIESS